MDFRSDYAEDHLTPAMRARRDAKRAAIAAKDARNATGDPEPTGTLHLIGRVLKALGMILLVVAWCAAVVFAQVWNDGAIWIIGFFTLVIPGVTIWILVEWWREET